MANIYQTIYKRLVRLGIDPEKGIPEYAKSESGAYMDLHLNLLFDPDGVLRVSLAHYYEQNGDQVPDPDMEIRIYPDSKMAEAMTFQDSMGFQDVYPAPGTYYPKAKKDLNAFLATWLKNCLDQGHSFKTKEAQNAVR